MDLSRCVWFEGKGYSRGVTYQGGGECDEAQDEWAPQEDVAQRADQQQAASVARLHQRGDRGGLLEANVERLGDPVENGLVVVEIRHCKTRGLAFVWSVVSMQCTEGCRTAHKTEENVQPEGELGRVFGVIASRAGLPVPQSTDDSPYRSL